MNSDYGGKDMLRSQYLQLTNVISICIHMDLRMCRLHMHALAHEAHFDFCYAREFMLTLLLLFFFLFDKMNCTWLIHHTYCIVWYVCVGECMHACARASVCVFMYLLAHWWQLHFFYANTVKLLKAYVW